MGATTATSKASTAMRSLGRAAKLGAAVGLAAFAYEAKKSIDTTEDLAKGTISLHKNLGLSAKKASEFAAVARARGADSQKLGMAFKTLASQVSAAGHGSEEAQKVFKELGFSQKDLQRSMHDTQFAVTQVAAGFGDLPAGVDKATFAGKLFGRGWQTIFPILRDGTKAMNEQLAVADKYGSTFSGEKLRDWQDFLAIQRESKIAWQGMQVTLANALQPTIEDVLKQFNKMAAILASNKLTGQEKFSKIASMLGKDFKAVEDVILKMIPQIANAVGQEAPKVAIAFVKGFIQADIWGKLAIGGFLLSKFGGMAAVKSVGAKIGTVLFGGMFAKTTVAAAAGGGVTAAEGAAVGAGGAAGASALGAALGPVAAGLGGAFLLSQLPGRDTLAQRQHATTIAAPMARSAAAAAGSIHDSIRTIQHDFQAVTDDVGSDTHRVFRAIQGMSDKSREALRSYVIAQANAGDITHDVSDKILRMADRVGEQQKKTWHQIAKVTGESTKSVKKNVGDMSVSVSKDYGNMVEVSFAGMKMLVSKTNELTNQLGIKKEIQWSASSGRATGSALSNKGTPTSHARQRGGPIPGQGSGDKVPAMLEPGEFVMNREAVRGIGLARLQAMNKAIPRFASGGAVNADFSGMQPAIVSLAKTFLSKFGGYQSSGLRSGDPGFHGRGLASDIVPNDWAGATRYANQIGSSLLEGIHQGPPGSNVSWDSGHQVPPSFWGAATWAEHVSHIHLATQNAVKGAAKAVQKLKRILIKGAKGPLRDTAQASVDKVWKGANAFIEKQMPTSSFDVAIGKGSGTLTPQQFLAIANQAIKVTHSPGFTAGGLETLAMQESGLRVNPPPPHDINWPNNPSMGLMQVTLDTFKTYHQTGTSRNIVDPLANIAASINYQKARYGHQITFSPYAKGGLVMPPFGGSFGGGGIVPGPQGAARTIVAHGGEAVGKPEVHLHFAPGTEWLRDFVQVEVDGAVNGERRFGNQMARMRRA